MTENIPENEISFVVQGPILGSKSEKHEEKYTLRSLESIRKFFPGSEIVLSTWENQDVSGLDYDTLVRNKDPGTTVCHENGKQYNNSNRQIVSTLNGLKKSKGKYAVKMRSDTLLGSSGFTDYFKKYKEYSKKSKLLHEKVVISLAGSLSPHRRGFIFHLSDIFFFGYRKDLMNIWDIPLASEPEFSWWYKGKKSKFNMNPKGAWYRYISEQYLWLSFFRKYNKLDYEVTTKCTDEHIQRFEDFVANNVIPVSMNKIKITLLKHPRANFLETIDYSGYTFKEWLKLYNKYCGANVSVSPDLRLLEKKTVHGIASLIPDYIKIKFLGMPA